MILRIQFMLNIMRWSYGSPIDFRSQKLPILLKKKTTINITCNFQKSAVGSCFSGTFTSHTAPPTRMKIVQTHLGLSASLKGTMAVTGFLGRKILKYLKGRDYLLTNWLVYLYGRIQSPRPDVMPDRREGITRAAGFVFACIDTQTS